MPKSNKCDICGKPTRTHRKANHGRSKKGSSALKPLVKRKEAKEATFGKTRDYGAL